MFPQPIAPLRTTGLTVPLPQPIVPLNPVALTIPLPQPVGPPTDITYYVFNDTALMLYRMWRQRPLAQLVKDPMYTKIIQDLSPRQVNQYNLWLALPQEERQSIQDELDEVGDSVVLAVSRYYAQSLKEERIKTVPGIVSSQDLGNGYTEYTDNQGQKYLTWNRH